MGCTSESEAKYAKEVQREGHRFTISKKVRNDRGEGERVHYYGAGTHRDAEVRHRGWRALRKSN